MSHFIMICRSSYSSGTPKGQAMTQLPHAMQRGLRALWTTPSAVRLIASAGQTSAHVGCSQCMQTTGTVCTLCARSTNSRWIIDSPRCVSHSLQACTHDWQPMQRFGSMKKCSRSGLAISVLLLRLQGPVVVRRPVGPADAAAAHLVLGNLADRILRGHRELVGALLSRPVIRDEHGIRTD